MHKKQFYGWAVLHMMSKLNFMYKIGVMALLKVHWCKGSHAFHISWGDVRGLFWINWRMSSDSYKRLGQKERLTSKEPNNFHAKWSKEWQFIIKHKGQKLGEKQQIHKIEVHKPPFIIHYLLCSQGTLNQCSLQELCGLKSSLVPIQTPSFLCTRSSLSFCVAQGSLSLDSLPGQPLCLSSLCWVTIIMQM